MKKGLLCPVIFLLSTLPCLAGSSPAEIVQQYCQYDFEGARLSSETWPQVAHLISWEVEPGWDIASGVAGFRVVSEKMSGNKATVQVLYLVTPNELVEFTLQKFDETWRIVSPIHQPHVSQKLLCEKFSQCSDGGQ